MFNIPDRGNINILQLIVIFYEYSYRDEPINRKLICTADINRPINLN